MGNENETMKLLNLIFVFTLSHVFIQAQDLVLLDGPNTKTIKTGKFLSFEMLPPGQDTCDFNIVDVYGKLIRTDDYSVSQNNISRNYISENKFVFWESITRKGFDIRK